MSERARWECVCWCCGTRFKAVRETATYCSPRCRQTASRVHRGQRVKGQANLFDKVFRQRPRWIGPGKSPLRIVDLSDGPRGLWR